MSASLASSSNSRWFVALVLLLGFTGIWRLQYSIDTQRAALRQERDDLVLRSPALVKMMSLEYAPLVADLYWTRVVQYYGDKHARRDADMQLLWPLLDITTTLDPYLAPAYRFGSTFLSEPAPRGADRPDLAAELIQRGIQANRDYWRLYQDLGYIYYFNLKDYTKASAAFLEGSKNPKAQVWMKALAAKVLEQGQTRETSAFLWGELYNSTNDPLVKKNALTHLQLMKAEIDREKLNAFVEEYAKKAAHRPASMRDLVNAGLIPQVPLDPLGLPYVLDAQGKAQLNPASPLVKEESNNLAP